MAAQSHKKMKKNYIKVKINNTLQNKKFMWWQRLQGTTGREGNPPEIVQEIEIWQRCQMVCTNKNLFKKWGL